MVILRLFDILTNFLFTTSEKRSMIISTEHGINKSPPEVLDNLRLES